MPEKVKKQIIFLKLLKVLVFILAVLLPFAGYFIVGSETLLITFFIILAIAEIFISFYLLNTIVKKLEENK